MIKRTLTLLVLALFTSQTAAFAQTGSAYNTGEFEVQSTIVDLLGAEAAKAYEKIIKPDEELRWHIYVPDSYSSDKPAGIVVFFTDRYPNQVESGWKGSAQEKNFIWISAAGIRNATDRKKLLMGVLATAMVQSLFEVDQKRIYTSGDVIGCGFASSIAKYYPNIFSGAIYTSCKAQTWRKELPPGIDLMRQHRYVFVASARSENNREIRRSLIKYNKAGIENTEFEIVSVLNMDVKLNNNQISKYISYLDGTISKIN